MLKKMVILGMTATMLLCGCGRTEVKENKSEVDVIVEEATTDTDELENSVKDMLESNSYLEAIKEVFGDDVDMTSLEIEEDGIRYGESWVSKEYFEEIRSNTDSYRTLMCF